LNARQVTLVQGHRFLRRNSTRQRLRSAESVAGERYLLLLLLLRARRIVGTRWLSSAYRSGPAVLYSSVPFPAASTTRALARAEWDASRHRLANVHFPGRKGLDKPAVLVFPRLAVCLNCGFTQFALPEAQLLLLREGVAA